MLLVRIKSGSAVVLPKLERNELRSLSRDFRADRAEVWFFRKRGVEREVVYQSTANDDELQSLMTRVDAAAGALAPILEISGDAPRLMLALKCGLHCLYSIKQLPTLENLHELFAKMGTEEEERKLTSVDAKACWNTMAKLGPEVITYLRDRTSLLISPPKYATRGLFDLRLRDKYHCRFCYHEVAEHEYAVALRFATAAEAVGAAGLMDIPEWRVTDSAGKVVKEKKELWSKHHPLLHLPGGGRLWQHENSYDLETVQGVKMDFPIRAVGLNGVQLAELLASVEAEPLANADADVIVKHGFLFSGLMQVESSAAPKTRSGDKRKRPDDDPALINQLGAGIATHCIDCEYESASDFERCPKCNGKQIVQIDRRRN